MASRMDALLRDARGRISRGSTRGLPAFLGFGAPGLHRALGYPYVIAPSDQRIVQILTERRGFRRTVGETSPSIRR